MTYAFLALAGDLIIAASLIPQIVRIIKTKKADDLSKYMMLSWIFGNGLLLAYNILVVKDSWLIILFFWNLFSALTLLILYFMFRKKK